MSSNAKLRRPRQNSSRHRRENSARNSVVDKRAPSSTPPMLGRSNLDCFLDHITPSVQCQYSVKSCLDTCCKGCKETMPSFHLCDLWSSFDEWSAYGAGVPLRLPCGETVMQYYVPYLSAMQIYLQPGCSTWSSKRRPGEESDWSDISDMRDTSSDCGSDNESEKVRSRWDSSSCLSSERLSSASSEQGDRHGDLVFEYFERAPPHGRAPFAGKIRELATGFPHLLTLSSHQLSPSSWVSVAWYPIYRIPMGPTMSNLSTCFLTYHSLWTPHHLQDAEKGCGREDDDSHIGVCNRDGYIYSLEFDDHTDKQEQERWLRCHSAWRMKSRETLEVPAFALASYKLRGPFWESAEPADKQQVVSLASSANAWLRQLRVQHPDFDFFVSREGARMYK